MTFTNLDILNYLLKADRYQSLDEALANHNVIQGFIADEAKKATLVFGLSPAVAAWLPDRKIQAIKQHRQEVRDAGLDCGLKESKDIIDAAIAANPAWARKSEGYHY